MKTEHRRSQTNLEKCTTKTYRVPINAGRAEYPALADRRRSRLTLSVKGTLDHRIQHPAIDVEVPLKN
ncbi:MAG: hypothetical protein KME06_19115 [Kastovskya adunca ATA6-11-RM4]|nr:hypothetical protein [Kastovskya adunca ATA6-11-RM4]